MTPLFQKRNFYGNFITFFRSVKITNYKLLFKCYVHTVQGADPKKVFAVETKRCVSVRNVFVMTSQFWYYRGVTLDWLRVLDFQPSKMICV